MITASKNKHFVITDFGYEETPDDMKHERTVGKPLNGYEFHVPYHWLKKGYVEEVDIQ